jgi:ABC-2 type transport system ATP-binding protein
MLHLKKFQKSYGAITVLKIDDLLIQSGIFWIKGANGSGKSTLLKAIAGIISFDGDILLNQSVSIKKQPITYRKLINFAEAEPIFPEFLTGMEMIKLFASAKEAPKGQHEYYVEIMKMGDYVDKPLGTYSSGMLKKLSIVLAFMGNPKIILLDEPLNTIDNESLKVLYKLITERYQKGKVSFLLSSHQSLEIDESIITTELIVENRDVKFKT